MNIFHDRVRRALDAEVQAILETPVIGSRLDPARLLRILARAKPERRPCVLRPDRKGRIVLPKKIRAKAYRATVDPDGTVHLKPKICKPICKSAKSPGKSR